jgi:protein ImuB
MPARDPTLDLFSSAVAAAETAPVSGPVVVQAPAHPQARRCRELWLAVSLPVLSLEALTPEPAADTARIVGPTATVQSRAIAVVDPELDHTVIACNACAGRAGIVPGLGLNAAHALVRQLEVRGRDRSREQTLLERLASGGVAFTPRVVAVEPDALLLEVRGSLKLFGGIEALGRRLQQWLDGQRVTHVLALAPTPLAALWLARAEGGVTTWPVVMQLGELPGRLAALPLHCLRWPERACRDLQAMGVNTVGDCLRLPRDGFARRFGPGLLGDLDQALGRIPDVRRAHVPRQRYNAGLELEHEITDVPRLVRTLEPLLLTLGSFLRKRQCCLRVFELKLQHRSVPATRVVIRLVAPSAEAAHLIELVSARLERIVLPAPVHHVRLRSGTLIPIDAAMAAMADVFEAARGDIDPAKGASLARRRQPVSVPRLVERLRARLGVEAVHGLCLVPEHRPESASRVAEPRVRSPVRSGRSKPLRAQSLDPRVRIELETPRPLWLLSEPRRLSIERDRPWYDGPLVLEQGPERIESGWWDGADVARDYYVARTRAGLTLWIYRERRADRRWFLHGVFA